jgi:hypothetical protein
LTTDISNFRVEEEAKQETIRDYYIFHGGLFLGFFSDPESLATCVSETSVGFQSIIALYPRRQNSS